MQGMTRAGWLLVIIGLIWTGFYVNSAFTPKTVAEPGEVLERPWVDHVPHHEKEPFRLYYFARARHDNGEMLGLYIFAESSYKRHMELFSHDISDKDIRFTWLHDNVKATSGYKLERIPADKDGLDFKLSLTRDSRGKGKATVFYTSSNWSQKDLPEFLSASVPQF